MKLIQGFGGDTVANLIKYAQVLFARSEFIDYRWMIVPSFASSSDLNRLEKLAVALSRMRDMDSWKGKLQTEDSFKPTYCCRLPSMIILAQYTWTPQRDQTRYIYPFQGIAVEPAYSAVFNEALPWMLNQTNTLLNVWQTINFQEADKLRKAHSREFEFPVSAEPFRSEIDSQTLQLLSTEKTVMLDFDDIGLKQLQGILARNEHRFVRADFAFGAIQPIVDEFPTFKIIAPKTLQPPVEKPIEKEPQPHVQPLPNHHHGTTPPAPPPDSSSGGIFEKAASFLGFGKSSTPTKEIPAAKPTRVKPPPKKRDSSRVVQQIKEFVRQAKYNPQFAEKLPSYLAQDNEGVLAVGIPQLVVVIGNQIIFDKYRAFIKQGEIDEVWAIDLGNECVKVANHEGFTQYGMEESARSDIFHELSIPVRELIDS